MWINVIGNSCWLQTQLRLARYSLHAEGPHHWSIVTRANCTTLYQKIHMNKSSDNAEVVEVSNLFNRSEFTHWHSIQVNLMFGKVDWCHHVPSENMIPLNKSPFFLRYCSTRSSEIQTHITFILATNILAPILCYNNWTHLIT